MPTLAQINAVANTCPYTFPPHEVADPDNVGLIAFGGDLEIETLLHAYRIGLFPWFNDNEPIAWWSPTPRCVIVPSDFVPKKSLIRTAKKNEFVITLNQAFTKVIKSCSLPRAYEKTTWITDDIKGAYGDLHKVGISHSLEVWHNGDLVGGLYGQKIGACFFGESMFHKATDASKLAFWALTVLCRQTGVQLIDCQVVNEHLTSLGAVAMDRDEFLPYLAKLVDEHNPIASGADDWSALNWQMRVGELAVF